MSNDCWKTPNQPNQPIVDLVLKVLGAIDLDPTSDDSGHIPAAKYYTSFYSCFWPSNEWYGRVYMNPPFSNPKPFVQRLCEEYANAHITEAIALLKSGTIHNKGTGSLIADYATAMCFWGAGRNSRIAFLNEDNEAIAGADFDCTLVYFGSNPQKFVNTFAPYGHCVYAQSCQDTFNR